MEHLGHHPAGLTGAEIAAGLKLSKNCVFRITMTLLDYGYLVREEDTKRYALSRKMLALGYTAVGEHSLVEKAIDIMRELRDRITETVIMGTLLGDEGIALEQAPGLQLFRFAVEPGTRLTLHASAPGKCLLAFLPDSEREPLLKRLTLTRFNARTITNRDKLRKALQHIRETGYAVDWAEEFEGVHCVAAPVLNQHNHPIATIWTTGPADRVPARRFPELGALVREYAQRISARFGNGLIPALPKTTA